MMHCKPGLALFVPLKEWELGDPQEVVLSFRNQLELFAQGQTQLSESWQNNAVFVRYDEDNVALFAAEGVEQCAQLFFAHEFSKGAVWFFVSPADECKTFCTDTFCLFGQFVDCFSGQSGCCILCNDAANRTALSNCICKYREGAVLNLFGEVNNFHAKAGIRLVRTITFHCFVEGQARHFWNVDSLNLFVQASHIAFQHVHDIFLSNKGHFQVDLSKLWLTVGTQVLVAEASCKLDISVKSG